MINCCMESLHKSRPHSVHKDKLPTKYHYSSMWLCNIEKEKEELRNRKKENFTVFIEKNGLRIVSYINKREKCKASKNKEERKYYDYFEHHRNCKETELLDKDILHPKLVRHYSKEKEKKFPMTEIKSEVLSLSSSLRFRNIVKKNNAKYINFNK